MDNARNNSNWLALLRRKIQKKFKRNRQKTPSEVATENEVAPIENPEIQAQIEGELQAQAIPEGTQEEVSDEYKEMRKELFKLSCYWPKLTRAGAQRILKNTQNGSFLIRDSGTPGSITLSFRSNNKTFHCRNQWSSQILSSPQGNYNIISAIEDSIKKSQSSVVGFVKCDNNELSVPIAVRLIYPIIRNVPSLQNLCLSLVASNISSSAINSLPLPPKIKEIVRENYNTL